MADVLTTQKLRDLCNFYFLFLLLWLMIGYMVIVFT